MKKKAIDFSVITRSKITWAVVAEILILLVCFIIRPDFFSISIQPSTGVLYGSLIDILNRSAEMLLTCMLMGLFNGILISKGGMQPFIATLILMVSGRGIAQILTNGKQFTTMYSPFRVIGQGHLGPIPMPIIIMTVVCFAMAVFVRKTAFGTFVESVGVNKSASRLSGISSDTVIIIVYTLTGLLAGIAGLIYSSRIMSNDSNNAGINYEMDAILAVVIGGTAMTGGKFSLIGTIIGSIIIRTIVTFVYYFGIVAEATMAFKALIIAVVIILQSEPVREYFARRSEKRALQG